MNESSRHYAGWRAAFACAAGSFFASFPYYTFALFLKPVSAEFSWSRESVAAAYATMAFTAAAAAPFLGRVIDRVGARRVIVPALIVLGLAVASLSMLTPSLQHLYAVGVVIGVASIGASAVAGQRNERRTARTGNPATIPRSPSREGRFRLIAAKRNDLAEQSGNRAAITVVHIVAV